MSDQENQILLSRPTRGAWIEICRHSRDTLKDGMRRAPHGARGLKSMELDNYEEDGKSRPTRGAWIEIARRPRYAA